MKYLIIPILILFSFMNPKKNTVKVVEIEYLNTIKYDSINISWQGNWVLKRIENMSTFAYGGLIKNTINTKKNISIKPLKNKILYKNYTSNTLLSKGSVGFRVFNIKDSINIINWDIKTDQQTILGYTCTLAESTFRGRSYKAWFTSDLMVGGPWKFDGLPGMILKVGSKDNYFSYEAVKIQITNKEKHTIDTSNPHKNEKTFYTWSEFKEKYKKNAIKTNKYMLGNNTRIFTPRIKKERYIEENDPDYKAKKPVIHKH